MNRRAVSLSALACAALGCWLPSLWLPAAPAATRSLSLTLPPSPKTPPPNLAASVRSAPSFMAKLQTVVDGAADRRIGPASRPADMGGFGFALAERLAASLAGEAAGRNVRDPAVFLKSVKDAGDEAFGNAAIQAWVESDPDAALASLLRPEGIGVHGSRSGLRALAARHPDKLLAALKAAGSGTPSVRYAWQKSLQAFAENDPAFALTAIQAAPEYERQNAMYGVLRHLAEEDPAAALAWYEKLTPEQKKWSDTSAIFSTWAKTDPAAALAACEAAGETSAASSREDLLWTWAEHNPDTYISWVREHPDAAASDDLELAFGQLAWGDGPRAAALLATLPPLQQKNLLTEVGEKWSDYDPAAAFAWARTLPQEDCLRVVSNMLSRLDSLPPPELRAVAEAAGTDTIEGFRILQRLDPAAARSALSAMPPETASSLGAQTVQDLMYTEPVEAARYLSSLLAEPDPDELSPSDSAALQAQQNLSGKLAEITTALTARDPAAAAAWIHELPPGLPQTTATVNLALTWGRTDLPAARAWVEQLPEGEARTKAAAEITRLTKLSGE